MGLFTPAWKSEDVTKAYDAIKRIDDPEKLKKIAMKAPHGVYAAEKITDETLLTQIIWKGKEFGAAQTALRNMNNEAILTEIALNHSYYSIRRDAVEKIDNDAVLAKIALQDESEYVRREAAEKIIDQDILKKIAHTDVDYYNRAMAYRKLNGCPNVLRKLIPKNFSVEKKEIADAIEWMKTDRLASKACWDYLAEKYKNEHIDDKGKHHDSRVSNDCGHVDVSTKFHSDYHSGIDFPPYPFDD